MTCSPCVEINNVSKQLGEAPTKIAFTPEWPYGRYTYPEGGRFIREYGRSAPLPEALTELQLSEAPVEVPHVTSRAYTAIGGKAAPYWGVPEIIEAAQAEMRPSPPYEREYLAGLGRPKYGGLGPSLTVESKITSVEVPSSVKVDEQFVIKVFIKTAGTGCDKQFLAIFDQTLGDYVGAGISDECLPPGTTGTWTATFKPLKDWYPLPTIPSTLNWIARVGYVTAERPGEFDGIITDERQFSIPVAEVPPPPPPPDWWEKYKYYIIAGSAVAMVGIAYVAAR